MPRLFVVGVLGQTDEEKVSLLNVATFIALLVVALQYIINNFVANVLEERYRRKHKTDARTARRKRNDFVRKWSWVILILFIAAIAFGAIGLVRDLILPTTPNTHQPISLDK